ncbi:MAG: efflux transporter outer membrane subunit [Desulfovibrionaceae bacterium]|nr:efflux transporter outer membrane subunit [Desulfovibrionaceae bacterium]
MRRRFLTAFTILLMAGCSMAPRYERPESPVDGSFPDYPEYRGVGAEESETPLLSLSPADGWGETEKAGAEDPAPGNLPWQEFYVDPDMQKLIAFALENNRDLRLAALNRERIRALYQIQRGELLPAITGVGSYANQSGPTFLPPPSPDSAISRRYSLSVGLVSYELDFFGRITSLKDAALENYLASAHAAHSARIAMVAEVASLYLQIVAGREQYELTRNTYSSRRESYDLIAAMYRQGLASQLTVNQARAAMEEARVNAVNIRTTVLRLENALALLIGGALPQNLVIPSRLAEVRKFQDLPEGLPSWLLERRPDILQAEHSLKSANANIGAARASFFPSISLTASLGMISADLDTLFDSNSRAWSFTPQIALPIFSGGRQVAGLEAANLQRDMAVASYEKTIQSAFREVADTLAQRSTINEQLEATRSLRDAARQSYDISNVRYKNGVDSFMNVLDTQRLLFSAQQAYINSELQREINTINLYKALGGGWR